MRSFLHWRNPPLPLWPHKWTLFHHYSSELRPTSCHPYPIPSDSISRLHGLLAPYTNYLIPPLTTFAVSLKSHTNLFSNMSHSRPKHPLNPTSTPAPSGTYSFLSVSYSTADEEHSVFVRKLHYDTSFFVSFLRPTTLTCGPDDANRLS